MFGDAQNLLKDVQAGNADSSEAVKQHLQTAASNAKQSGNVDLAQQLEAIVSQNASNPQALKDQAVALIAKNPQVLEHFAPEFARDVLSRM